MHCFATLLESLNTITVNQCVLKGRGLSSQEVQVVAQASAEQQRALDLLAQNIPHRPFIRALTESSPQA